jgi:predicted amidohydrolase
MIRIVCQQVAPRVGELKANFRLSLAAIRDGFSRGADIVVLPELVTSGYVFTSHEEAASVAITPAHSLFSDWAAEANAAGSGLVIGGFCEAGVNGSLYNSAAIVDQGGVVAVYRKIHLWDREKVFFVPGSETPPVLDTQFGRIGVLICYDLEFPEITRILALAGAELIVVPTNWPRSEHPAGEHPPEVLLAMAAARTNRVFIACCDRAGDERGQAWTAGTTIISETGWILAAAQNGVAVADIDLSRARTKQLSALVDIFGDRRPELYGAVAELGASIRPR